MLNNLKAEFNKGQTTNGAKAFNSTNSAVLDLFSRGGAMRYASDEEIKVMASKAFSEDKQLTLRALFYLRDVRGGQGERRLFRVAINHLANVDKKSVEKNIHLFSEYGRWDDLLSLLDTPLKSNVVDLIGAQIASDLTKADKGEVISLLGKWLPSENASSHETKRLAKIIRKSLEISPKEYRKALSTLRKHIGILESKLTEKRYGEIEYDKIPSLAGLKYRQAFFRNDEERYQKFLDSLSENKVKVNSATLYPYDIASKILGNGWNFSNEFISDENRKLYNGMWENLPNYITEPENSLVMADVSGSMFGEPISVATSLALYIAERNKGPFHNHFMTFSPAPELVEISGTDIVEKIKNISKADWGMSTNIRLAFDKILDVAVRNKTPQEELPSKLYIISDMQFDFAVDNATALEVARKSFEEEGYKLPQVVFWNVNGSANSPATQNEYGVTLVSGRSPSVLKFALNCDKFTPYDFMLEVLNSERYEKVSI